MLIKFIVGTVLHSFGGVQTVDWQFTKWDMSSREVLAASKGSVAPYSNPDHNRGDSVAKLAGNYNAAGFAFTAIFSFDAQDHLAYVELDPMNGTQCDDLYQKLQRNYGQPASTTDYSEMWSDPQNHNKIVFFKVGGCNVTYSPLNRAGSGGL